MKIFVDRARIQLGKFEFILIVVMICAVALVALQRAERLSADAEQLSMELNIRALRYAVTAEALMRNLRGEREQLAALAGSNPMQLVEPPANYAGELRGGRQAPAGHWYFDASCGELVYRVARARKFSSAEGDRLRFRIAFPASALSAGLPELELLTPYVWGQ